MRLSVWILATVVLSATAFTSPGCREAEEDLPPDPSPVVSTTEAALTTTGVADPGLPPDWVTYKDPNGRFTLNYPPGWFRSDSSASTVTSPGYLVATFSNFKAEGGGGDFPLTGLKVDLRVYSPRTGDDCRPVPEDGTPDSLGGVAGWRRIVGETAAADGRSTMVVVYADGHCYELTAYFGQANSDDELFEGIIRSFTFTSKAS